MWGGLGLRIQRMLWLEELFYQWLRGLDNSSADNRNDNTLCPARVILKSCTYFVHGQLMHENEFCQFCSFSNPKSSLVLLLLTIAFLMASFSAQWKLTAGPNVSSLLVLTKVISFNSKGIENEFYCVEYHLLLSILEKLRYV